MKMFPKKLTFKIIVSFLLLLLINHFSFFLIIIFFKAEQSKRDHDFYMTISTYAFKEFIDKRLELNSLKEISSSLQNGKALDDISESYHLEIVITDSRLNILSKPTGKNEEGYRTLILDKDKNTDAIRSPFPLAIPFETKIGEKGSIWLFNDFYTRSSDTKLNFTLLALLFFNIIALVLLSKKLTKPIAEFDKAVKSISEGDFSARVKKVSDDEFGKLAETLNSMAAKIQNVINEQKETSAHISHELRSPLTRINVALQLLRDLDEQKNENSIRYIDVIEKEIILMDKLIDRILEYYRLDGIPTEPKAEINIIKILDTEVGSQLNVFRQLSIEAALEYSKESFTAYLFPSVRSVFENILCNAIKYTPKYGKLVISEKRTDDTIILRFENGFLGQKESLISEEKLFEPFYRGTNAKNISGNGMGLAIAKKICARNSCGIKASITENKFTIEMTIPSSSTTH